MAGFRGGQDAEKPLGEWNTLECVCDGDRITNILNGKVVNAGTGATPSRGKLLFQSEGAEVFFRRIDLLEPGDERGHGDVAEVVNPQRIGVLEAREGEGLLKKMRIRRLVDRTAPARRSTRPVPAWSAWPSSSLNGRAAGRPSRRPRPRAASATIAHAWADPRGAKSVG